MELFDSDACSSLQQTYKNLKSQTYFPHDLPACLHTPSLQTVRYEEAFLTHPSGVVHVYFYCFEETQRASSGEQKDFRLTIKTSKIILLDSCPLMEIHVSLSSFVVLNEDKLKRKVEDCKELVKLCHQNSEDASVSHDF